MNGLILAALLLTPAFSQERLPTQAVESFKGGLNTWLSPLSIADDESPNLLNVLLDERGGITRRQGFSKRNVTAIGGGSQDVNAVYQLEQTDGTRYCIAFSSTNGYYSSDACATFTSFISTLTLNNNVNCDALQFRLYCSNNQYNFYVSGTDDSNISAAPANLDGVRVFRNRCFGWGNSTNPSRLFWSNISDCTAWTTSTDWVDISPQDGDVLLGCGPPIFDMLPCYKKFSTWVLKGPDPASFALINVSRTTGIQNYRSADNFGNIQIFDSLGPYGGRPGLYAFDGIVVKEISQKLRHDIDNADTFHSNTGRKLIDTKGDWDLGTFGSMMMSSSRDAGFMQSSYTAFTDTTGTDFSEGTFTNVSTGDVTGALTLSSDTFKDDFADGNYTSNPAWTVNAGCWQVAGNELSQCLAGNDEIYSPTTVSTGSWKFGLTQSGVSRTARIYFVCSTSASGTCDGYDLVLAFNSLGTEINEAIRRVDDGVETGLCDLTSTLGAGAQRVYTVTRTQLGEFLLDRDGTTICTATDTTYSASNNVVIQVNTSAQSFDNFDFYGYKSSGTWLRTYDTAISTPAWGLLTATLSTGTANASTVTTFKVRSSSNNTSWGTLSSQDLDVRIVAPRLRYLQMEATLTTPCSTCTPQLLSDSVAAAATGTWTSAEMFLSNNISAGGWGLFQAQETKTGSAAEITYSIRVASYSGGTQYASYTSITNETAITLSTGAYFQVISTVTLTVATETSKIDSIAINWTEGAAARSSSGKTFNGRYHYGAQSQNGSFNDVIYLLDTNGAWTKWTGVRPRHLNVVNQNFVMGDSTRTTGGFIHKLYDTDSDDGLAINAIYDTKDYALGQIGQSKAVDRVFAVHGTSSTVLSVGVLADGGINSQTFSVDLSTGIPYDVKVLNIEPPLSGRYFRLRFSNNAASKPWEVIGAGIQFRNLGQIQP